MSSDRLAGASDGLISQSFKKKENTLTSLND